MGTINISFSFHCRKINHMCDDKWQLYLALALGLQKGKAGLISNNRMHSTQTHDNHCSTSHYSHIPTMNKKEVGKGEKGKRAFKSIPTNPSLMPCAFISFWPLYLQRRLGNIIFYLGTLLPPVLI